MGPRSEFQSGVNWYTERKAVTKSKLKPLELNAVN